MSSERTLRMPGLWALGLLAMLMYPSPGNGFNYPDIDWRTHETDHFVIHYYNDVSWTAAKVAQVAEEIYLTITGIYNHEPKNKTHIVVRDDEDTSNGFAIYSLGYMTIWASPSTLSLRGRHDWVRGVITHEFDHIVSLQASTGGGYLIEGIRIGGVANTDTKHNTDVGGTVLIPTNTYHRWWAEGTAQVDTALAGHDLWDTHQDMLLRTCTLEDNLLDFHEMRNIYVREHLGGELVYNQGYAFLLWLNETYGKDANLKITRKAEEEWNLNFDDNIVEALGKTSQELYDEWVAHLKTKYEAQVAEIRKVPHDGTRIELLSAKAMSQGDRRDRPFKDGTYNFYPRFSPDGRWFSYASRGVLKLRYLEAPFVLTPPSSDEDKATDRPTPLQLSFTARSYAWAPDSQSLLLSKRKSNSLGGYPYYDLFRLDLRTISELRTEYLKNFRAAKDQKARKRATSRYKWKKQGLKIEPTRLTHQLRGTHISWSPDGKQIAYAQNKDGHRHLRLTDPDGKIHRDLVAIGGDAEAIDPAWSPDSQQIAFTLFNHDQSDIWLVDVKSGELTPLTLDEADDRYPTFHPNGREIFFASDRTGIFQIYRATLPTSEASKVTQITNVETSAFMPYVVPDGSELFYSRFSSAGFKPYRLSLKNGGLNRPVAMRSPQGQAETRTRQLSAETVQPMAKTKRYFPTPRPIRIFPALLFENDQFKAGIGLQVSDFLEKHSFSASALFGREQDYQITYFNRIFYPTFFSSYTAYIRNDGIVFLDDGDGVADDAEGLIRDNIQFVNAGLLQEFELEHGLAGDHTVSLAYNRRFVDRRVGFPVLINNQLETSFRLITNDGVTVTWSYAKQPSRPDRDFDVNPRNATYVSASYSLAHTDLFSPDTTISDPNENYFHHEGTLSIVRYFPAPWEKEGWDYHSYWIRFTGGVKSRDVTDLDEFFLGGRINFRAFGQISSNTLFYGYEDFSISGETLLLLAAGYTLPVARAIDKKTGFLYWDSVYASFFYEIGNAWNFGEHRNLEQNPSGDPTIGDGTVVLHDVGAELKLKAYIFNDYNSWNSVLRMAYGFQDDAAHGFSDSDFPVRIYVGIGTNF